MRQMLSGPERAVRSGLGIVIVAIGAYTVLVNLWLGLFVLGVGAFTIFEGYKGWTLVAQLTEAWIKEEVVPDELVGLEAEEAKEWTAPH